MKVNYSRIQDIAGDDTDLIKTLLELFVDSFKKCLIDMEECLTLDASEHQKQWYESCHELKGSALNLGFEELGKFCKDIEHIEGKIEHKKEIISRLKDILGDVMDIIAKIDT